MLLFFEFQFLDMKQSSTTYELAIFIFFSVNSYSDPLPTSLTRSYISYTPSWARMGSAPAGSLSPLSAELGKACQHVLPLCSGLLSLLLDAPSHALAHREEGNTKGSSSLTGSSAAPECTSLPGAPGVHPLQACTTLDAPASLRARPGRCSVFTCAAISLFSSIFQIGRAHV